MATEILSDEQIEELLQEVEARLQQQATHQTGTHSSDEINLEDQDARAPKKKPIPKLRHNLNKVSYIEDKDGVAHTNPSLANKRERMLGDRLRTIDINAKSKKTNDNLTSGPEWFDLPKTSMTPQLKRDLQLIELRSVLDPHRHYKKNNRQGKVPMFSQVGTVVEGPTEWYSSRINRKDRAKNFVQEALVTEKETGRFKRKYAEIQEKKTSGKKAHYRKLMEKRKKKV